MFQRFRSWILLVIVALIVGVGIYTAVKKPYSQAIDTEVKGVQSQQTISTTLEITGTSTPRSWNLEAPAKSTALDVLNIASKQYNVPIGTKEYSFGTMVEEIDGIKADTTANKYWTYYVNGQLSQVGAGQYEVQNGDTITWKYGE